MRTVRWLFVFALFGCNEGPVGCAFNNHLEPFRNGLCTASQACIDAPCTPGCLFTDGVPVAGSSDRACVAAQPYSIAPADVTTCANVCGGPNGGTCYRFDATAPGCDQPIACGESYPTSCYITGGSAGVGNFVLCADGETCSNDVATPECDLAVPVDMPASDLATID